MKVCCFLKEFFEKCYFFLENIWLFFWLLFFGLSDKVLSKDGMGFCGFDLFGFKIIFVGLVISVGWVEFWIVF